MATRGFAVLERNRLRSTQGREVSTPDYTVAAPGSGHVRRLLTPPRDVQSWLDLQVVRQLGLHAGAAGHRHVLAVVHHLRSGPAQ